MAFGAGELHVLRRALALAVHPRPASAQDVQDCLHLAESVDEAAREGARLRAFLVDDLDRYRAALPGSATGYLDLLEEALAAGYQPAPDDLAALRALRGNPVAAALLERCRVLAERAVRARLAARAVPVVRVPVPAPVPSAAGRVPVPARSTPARPVPARPTPAVSVPAVSVPAVSVPAVRAPAVPVPAVRAPVSRARLTALPGGLVAPRARDEDAPAERPERPPGERPGGTPAPHRPVPTPAEVFPPRRRPAPSGEPAAPARPADPAEPDAEPAPPADPPQRRAAG